MGKHGPQRTKQAVLEARGSWRATARKKAELQAASDLANRIIHGAGASRVKRFKYKKLTDAYLKEVIKEIPGYDPCKGAADFIFRPDFARKVIQFFHDKLSHSKGEKALQAFILERWQQAIVANLFGWVHKRDKGKRRYREAFIEIARKNGKSFLVGGILLYLLTSDGESGAEVYGAASEYKQAAIVFEYARAMIVYGGEKVGPSVWKFGGKACQIFKGQAKSIQCEEDFSTYRVICAEALSAHGFNTHAAVIDEVHALQNRELYDVLSTSTAARRQPMMVLITTADYDREGSLCNAKEDHAEKVRSGVINDPSFLPVLYKAAAKDDWTSPETWKKANPNLGVSVQLEYIQQKCKYAQENPSEENAFKRLHLNMRSEQSVRWIQKEKWEAAAGKMNWKLLYEALKGRKCWGGLDLASVSDLTAYCLLFPHEGKKEGYTALWWHWVPVDTAERKQLKDNSAFYEDWIKQGAIEETPGNETDYVFVRKRINEINALYDVQKIAVDRLFQGAQLTQQLGEQDGWDMVPFGMGFLSLTAPSKEFERLVNRGQFVHGGNPVMRWQAANVAAKRDPMDNLKPDKSKSKGKIDGIVAGIIALGVAIYGQSETFVYNERPIEVF